MIIRIAEDCTSGMGAVQITWNDDGDHCFINAPSFGELKVSETELRTAHKILDFLFGKPNGPSSGS